MLKKFLFLLTIISIFLTSCVSNDFTSPEPEEAENIETTESTEDEVEAFEEAKADEEKKEEEKETETETEETEPYIRDTALLEENLYAYLDNMGIDSSLVGITYYNLEDDTSYSINGDVPFLAGSTSKVPIVMYLFDMANAGNVDLDQVLYVPEGSLEGGTGVIYYEYGAGAAFSLYELADLMITVSDNTATNMIYGYFSGYNGEYLLNTLAWQYDLSTYQGNYLTPNESITVLERIYYNEVENPLYEDLLDFMKNTVYNDYYTAYIPAEEIAHKTGDFEGYFNDIGIVYDDDSDYAFAAFTNNIPGSITVLNDLGVIVHEWHTGDEIEFDDVESEELGEEIEESEDSE